VLLSATADADVDADASWRDRALRAEAQVERLLADKAALNARVVELAGQVDRLSETVATLSGLLFGSSSEKGASRSGAGAGAAGDAVDGGSGGGPGGGPGARTGKRGQRRGAPGHGRRSYVHLETEEHIFDVDPGLRRCGCCGTDFEYLDTEDSEQIDWRVTLIRIVYRRRRYRRRCDCLAKLAGPKTVCAPRPARVVPKGLFTAQFLARLAYEKYVLGRPLHRIIAALAADGLDVAEGSLAGALKQIAPLVAPWARAIQAHVAGAGYVRADETTWRVFAGTPGKDGNRWWLWVFASDEATVFVMDPTRSAAVPATVLGIDRQQAALEAGRRLVISSDFYSAYQSLAKIEGIDPLWCLAHIRRYFLRAGDAHPDVLGQWCHAWTQRFAVLYRAHRALAEAMATETTETETRERALARYHRAFDNIDAARILETRQADQQHPAAAKVIATLNNEWDGLKRHRDLPHLDLDNNGAERALRTPVVGRKNFYGSGAPWAADLAADIWTITTTVAQNDIEPLHLLTGYLTCCAGNGGKPLTGDHLDAFLPWTPAGRARRSSGHQRHDGPDP
jgi:transposase